MALGRELSPVADLLSGATALRINGETLNFSMTVVENSSVTEVLDRFQAQCDAHPGPLAKEVRALAARIPKVVPAERLLGMLLPQAAMARQESDESGTLFCLSGDDRAKARDFAADFEKSGDLGDIGRLRYVLVNRGETRDKVSGPTRVTMLWTEESFKLRSFEPPAFGDAPGSDSTLAPRPPGALRIFSAVAVGSAYSIHLYETDAAPSDVLAFYDGAMTGWSKLTMKGYDQRGRGYIKDSRPLLVQVSRDESKTLVSISEVGGRGDVEKLVR